MWPAMRVPLKTRAGVAQAPIEPGERCLRWVPWERRQAFEVVALHASGEALSLGDADDVDDLAGLEDVRLDLGAERVVARGRRAAARRGGAPVSMLGLAKWPAVGLFGPLAPSPNASWIAV